jgi:DNA repair exonuclease SbcCD ATPase subunit
MSDLTDLTKEVAALKTDMAQINVLVDRLDLTIAKLTEVSTTVAQLLAVQGNRLEQQEKSANQFSLLIEKRRDELAESNDMLHKRISSSEKDFKAEIEKLNDKILNEMKSMRTESKQQHDELSDKMSKLEKWVWVVSGGGAVVGFLLSHVVNLDKFFN